MDEVGLRRGVPGLPGSEGRYAYQVNFATLGNPFDAEGGTVPSAPVRFALCRCAVWSVDCGSWAGRGG